MDIHRFKKESERLKSFNYGWSSIVPSSKMAKAGFYYTLSLDKVQCAFCKGVVGNWEKAEENVCNRYVKQPSLNSLLSKPRHPLHASEEARLKSYNVDGLRWPSENIVSSLDLAKAGLFYRGIGDSTTCFYCNGCLDEWEPGDIPYVEHARWFPRCEFIKLIKGIKFVKECLIKYPPGTTKMSPKALLETYQEHTSEGACSLEIMKTSSLKTLEEENKQLKEQTICKICMDHEIGVTFLPCGHLISCELCAPALNICPICRSNIRGCVRTFI
ncbi:Baculoviral IAP repeat-containing protein 7-B [Nymphon striatum]|nr:Baculoviral IAP repeat-containing protein 7-B [Nymphon striatum]